MSASGRPNSNPKRLVPNPKLRARSARFPQRRSTPSMSSSSASSQPTTPSARIVELSDDDVPETTGFTHSAGSYVPWRPTAPPAMPPAPPAIFSSLPVLRDVHVTATLIEQDATVARILPLVSSRVDPLPHLNRAGHIEFLESGIDGEALPPYMVSLDASRPWLVYWCLSGLALLGIDVTKYREQVISTLTPLQNATGGFGGGNGQLSHAAPTYAAVLSLALVGPSALSLVNRVTMLSWIRSLKNPDSSFRVCHGGETDVRSANCLLTAVSLLRLPTSDGLLDGVTEYLASCQSYEGGFSAALGTEAHGGYTFCAMAALCMLHPPTRLPSIIDMPALLRWLSARQYAPEGGLSGRTNKLVDGCYSCWIGGVWAFVEAAIEPQTSLWCREGLCRYILAAAQTPSGGLRDKPGKGPDFYHTNYNLLGLSAATYKYTWEDGQGINEEGAPLWAGFRWRAAQCEGPIVEAFPGWPDKLWVEGKEEEAEEYGLLGDRVVESHPCFNIPVKTVEAVERWWEEAGW